MARVLVEIPRVGLVMESARLVRWLKAVGDKVTQGEPLVEIETEKSVLEIEAAMDGTLAEILVQPEAEVAVGAAIAWIEDGKAEAAALPAAQTPGDTERVRSSPAARRLAEVQGIALASVTATGPGGRVQVEDVERAVAEKQVKQVKQANPSAGQPGIALTPMRRSVARIMALSNATVPQFTVSRALDWSEVQIQRARLAPQGLNLSVNDFLLQAVARTLIEFPLVNSLFIGDPNSPDAHVQAVTGAHIGLAVAVTDGMRVPVFHEVEKLSLAELAKMRQDLVERARAGRLRQEEASGATFSISNLGAQGPDQFNALITPPESGILAVGRLQEIPVARDGKVCIRPVSVLSLTMDHRLADGKLAAEFLARAVAILEAGEWH